jgi:formamidopyrimidine-DNA glycosylase
MPELPEVETIRQDLRKKILNKKIVQVEVRHHKSVMHENTKFVQALTGNAIKEIDRRGKLMIFRLKHGGLDVLVHLKMTGQLIYEKEVGKRVDLVAGGHKLSASDIENLPNEHTRIVFVFNDGSELFFNDLRLFGYMKLAEDAAVQKALKKFGPEPLTNDFTFAYFLSLFKKRKNTNLKALLLNQELIAGLGNIYVDEACWCAGIKPMRRVGSISPAQQQKLFTCIPKILKEALKHRGTTFRNFLDSSGRKGNYTDFLKVYDRDGEPCKRCKTIIKKTRAAGRGTHYCPGCQK